MKSTDILNKGWNKGWAVWFTGLPGSGKSKISKLVYKKLADEGIICKRIELDTIRKKYVVRPEYTDSERDFVYNKLIEFAEENVRNGINIIIDATAHKRSYRENARKKIERFVEVMIKCPLSVCIERESKRKNGHIVSQIYLRALERQHKGSRFEDLGKVIGVDIPYEENPFAEVIIDNSKDTAVQNAMVVKNALAKYLEL
ncbi:MAG: adenylyl-sulfate kinase [Desulfobacterales bacterium]|nr:adenylyl-sulfate kinase [Desulfobacterales bacterium]